MNGWMVARELLVETIRSDELLEIINSYADPADAWKALNKLRVYISEHRPTFVHATPSVLERPKVYETFAECARALVDKPLGFVALQLDVTGLDVHGKKTSS